MKDKTDILVDTIKDLYAQYRSMFGRTDIEMVTFRKFLWEEVADMYGIEDEGEEDGED